MSLSIVRTLIVGTLLIGALELVPVEGASILVTNPSFELDPTSFAFPGYGQPTGWVSSDPTRTGINPASDNQAPFTGSTVTPDGVFAGFVQSATVTGTLSQNLTGFDTTKQYWFQVFYGSRPVGSPANLNVTYGSQTLVNVTGIPVGPSPYTFVNVPFTPTTASGALTIANTANPAVDSTVLIDGISIIERTSYDVVIANPSFEASQLSTGTPSSSGVGYTPAIAGWSKNGRVATNSVFNSSLVPSSPFGVGTPPDGVEVAILQNFAPDASGPTTLSQTLPTLIPGKEYMLSFSAADRSNTTPGTFSVTLGAHSLLTHAITGVGGYTNYSLFFTATGADINPVLQFSVVTSGGDTAVFIDNISLVPEPSSLVLVGLSLIPLVRNRRRRD